MHKNGRGHCRLQVASSVPSILMDAREFLVQAGLMASGSTTVHGGVLSFTASLIGQLYFIFSARIPMVKF